MELSNTRFVDEVARGSFNETSMVAMKLRDNVFFPIISFYFAGIWMSGPREASVHDFFQYRKDALFSVDCSTGLWDHRLGKGVSKPFRKVFQTNKMDCCRLATKGFPFRLLTGVITNGKVAMLPSAPKRRVSCGDDHHHANTCSECGGKSRCKGKCAWDPDLKVCMSKSIFNTAPVIEVSPILDDDIEASISDTANNYGNEISAECNPMKTSAECTKQGASTLADYQPQPSALVQ